MYIYWILSSCKKFEKNNNETILEKCLDGRTEIRIDRWADKTIRAFRKKIKMKR